MPNPNNHSFDLSEAGVHSTGKRTATILRILSIFLLLLCGRLLLPAAAQAIDVQISNIKVMEAGRDLLVSFKIENAFNEKLEEAVLNGIPATFSFFIALTRKRDLWADETISEFSVTHTLKYHNLKNHFIITKSWENNKQMISDSFDEAKQMMSDISGLKFISRDKLEVGSRYRISVKAELDKGNLPRFLNYIFFFATMWDFETQWHSHDFFYPLSVLKGPEK